jgi:hypothetical protein
VYITQDAHTCGCGKVQAVQRDVHGNAINRDYNAEHALL